MTDIGVVQARTVLARAFADDPLMVWFFPDEDVRPHACAMLFGLFAEHYLADGRVDVAGGSAPSAVAMWQWPGGRSDQAPADTLPTLGGVMTAVLGPARAREVGGAMAGLAELRPAQPHAYLHLLGVHPDAWHRGLGGELLERGLADARRAGLVACLETMNPANVPFYEAHGLSVRSETRLGADGPMAWSMATG